MPSRKIKIACMFITLLLSINACGVTEYAVEPSASTDSKQMLYHREKHTMVEELIHAEQFFLYDEGGVFLCSGEIMKTTIDGERCTQIPLDIEANQSIMAIAVNASGVLFADIITVEGDEVAAETIAMVVDGEIQKSYSLEPLGTPKLMGFDNAGRLAVIYEDLQGDRLSIIDTNFIRTANIMVANVEKMFYSNGELYLYSCEENNQSEIRCIYSVNLQESSVALQTQFTDEAGTVFPTLDGALYLQDNTGVYSYDITAGKKEQLFQWDSLGLANNSVLPIFGKDKNNILFFSVSSNCMFSVTTAPSSGEDATIIKLACWIPAESIQWAAEQFNMAQSEYQVEIVSYYSEEGDTYAGIARMNADLLSGDSVDLYDLNGMNVTAMIKAGLLLDIYPFMDSDPEFNAEDYFSNIWGMMEQNGKLYQLAPAFSICGIAGPAGTLPADGWTIQAYLSLMNQNPDLYTMLSKNKEIILSECIRYGLYDIVDEDSYMCQFQTKQFYDILSLCDAYGEERSDGTLICTFIDGVNSVASLVSEFNGDFDLTGYPNSLSVGPVIDSFDSVAISSNTNHQEGAWRFIKYLLGADVQESLWGNEYFPIRRDAFERELSNARYPGTDARSSLAANFDFGLSENMINEIRTAVDQANRCAYTNSTVAEIIQENAQPYFAGEKEADDIANYIQSSVSIYLSEQQ